MSLLEAQSRISGKELDKPKMKTAIAAYEAAWKEWRALKTAHACCPTLYLDDKAVHCGPPFAQALEKFKELVGE